jgi:hypothetical protein
MASQEPTTVHGTQSDKFATIRILKSDLLLLKKASLLLDKPLYEVVSLIVAAFALYAQTQKGQRE